MSTLDASQQTAMEKPAVRLAYFLEFQFASATTYLSSLGHDLTWGGHDWIGRGQLGQVSVAEESDDLAPKAITYTLNVAQASWLALAVGDVAEWRGKPAKMYISPLDEGFKPIGTPALCWSGAIDNVPTNLNEDGDGSIQFKCETAAFSLKRRSALRMNDAQQKKKYPTDRGFEYINSLIAEQQRWLSVKFQTVEG